MTRLPVTHAQALTAIADLARLGGYKVVGFDRAPSRRTRRNKDGTEVPIFRTPWLFDGEGWPDLLCVRPAGWVVRGETTTSDSIVTVEVKVATGLRPAQKNWDDYLSRFRHIKNAVLRWPDDEATARRLFLEM